MRRLIPAVLIAAVAGGIAFASLPAGTPAAQAVVARPAAQAQTFKVDPVHTAVIFSAMYGQVAPFYGQFTDFRGTMSYDGSDPKSFSCDVEIPMESLDTHNAQRDGHLKSPDWFNAREYPTVRFKSTGLEVAAGGTMTLKGELTMHGVTRPVSAAVSNLATQDFGQRGFRLGLGCAFAVKRSDFGVSTMLGEQGIGDEIELFVGLQGVRE